MRTEIQPELSSQRVPWDQARPAWKKWHFLPFVHPERHPLALNTKLLDVLAGFLVNTWAHFILSSESHIDLDCVQEAEK